MTQKTKHALVVEGGAMRGIFAAGVLDGFIDHNYNPFDFCIGVSAGSTNIASWLSNQRGRTYTIIADYSCRPEFINHPAKDCTIHVIAPEDSFAVGRLTTSKDKLDAGYQMGLRAAKRAVKSN